ncbi:unnamed protein product, partial [Durusdinium trenchii]
AMSNPEELEELMPGEHKRQREALRRKINSNKGGLQPGLVEKYNAAKTDQEKFALVKAFIMDPTMDSVEVEAFYIQQSKEKSRGIWVELPLSELEQKYNTPEDREWLQKQVVARQAGTPHPQDPTNPRKRIYKVFEKFEHSSENSKLVGSYLSAKSRVAANKAQRQSLADHITHDAAGFGDHVKPMMAVEEQPGPRKPRVPKTPKVL